MLVVEDDPTIAGFVEKGLKEAGFAVDLASDGRDGLDRALAGRYDAAIVDVMLPGLDGLSLIDALRATATSRTPVLILSAKRSVDDRVRGLQAGGDDYLTKPFAFAELLARVQALIRRASGSRGADPADGRRSVARSAHAPGAPRRASRSTCVRASSRCSST